eukprot:c2966_g1_i1 orf=299-856(+)
MATQAPAPKVQVELYVGGKGPVHVFTAALKGWDQNRLDLEAIMQTHKLKAIYAFSLTSGRGNRLLFNPRNGLSRLAYSGKPDVTIRLDGDLSESFFLLLGKVLLGFVLIGGLAFLTLSDSLPDWLALFKESGRTHVAVLTCFITMLYTQLVWRPMKKSRFMAYDHILRSHQNVGSGPKADDKKDI